MEVRSLADTRRVLVIDPSEETREVLRTALGQRGMQVLAASEPGQGMELARQHAVDLIVLDLESEGAAAPPAVESRNSRGTAANSDTPALPGYSERGTAEPPATPPAGTPHEAPPLIILGTWRRAAERYPQGQFVAKPYHYGHLIHKIEELLQSACPQSHR